MIGSISSTKTNKRSSFCFSIHIVVLGIKSKQNSIHIMLLNSNGSPYLIPPTLVFCRGRKEHYCRKKIRQNHERGANCGSFPSNLASLLSHGTRHSHHPQKPSRTKKHTRIPPTKPHRRTSTKKHTRKPHQRTSIQTRNGPRHSHHPPQKPSRTKKHTRIPPTKPHRRTSTQTRNNHSS